ncbi:DNA polymerase III subunit beta [Calothrix sp. HK-06]|nr:DNA polymerase III subunit beta [Calothrix sp. HK-06]
MKVQINQALLSGAIESAVLAISSKPCTPITGCIIVEASEEENKITLKSTDASFSINQIIEADVEESGCVAVIGKKLKDTVLTLNGELTLSSDEQYLTITYESGLCRLAVNNNLDEFPQIEDSIKDTDPIGTLKLSALKFEKAISKVLYGAASDETKMVLTGTNFNITGDKLYTTTTDGHRVGRICMSLDKNNDEDENQLNFTIPAKILTSILKVLQKNAENNDCLINVFSKIVEINMPEIKIISRLLDGTYPAIESIITKKFIYEFTVERKAFQATIKRVENLAHEKDKSVLVSFSVNNCNAIVSTESSDYGEAYDSISIKPKTETSEDISIGFNIDYLTQAINSIDTDEIVIKCNTHTTPIVISPIGGLLEQTALVMPLQIRRNSVNTDTKTPTEKETTPKSNNKNTQPEVNTHTAPKTKTNTKKNTSTKGRKLKVAA